MEERWSKIVERPSFLAGVAAVAVVVIVLVAGGGSSNSKGKTPTTLKAGAPTTLVGPPTTKPIRPPPTTTRRGAADPALARDSDGADHFAKDGNLGQFPAFGPWISGAGSWKVLIHRATLAKSDPKAPNIAYFDAGTADVRAQVRLVRVLSGAGLAFRVVDAKNFWLWTVTPKYSTLTLVHVVGGQPKAVAFSGVIALDHDMLIGVHARGKVIQLLANGVVVKTVFDESKAPGQGLGMATMPGRGGAVFDDILFKRG